MRHDIQFLRGIAVLSVLFYHAQIGPFANGYLGVDIFFVISGFLITKIILKGLAGGSFSFAEFYLRRAKRLLPALYSTLIVTTLLAFVFLTHRQWSDYLEQFLGAITFTSNMVLPLQVGYFEDAAETKPLLHIWSLSLEEQYYFFLPLFLYLIPQRMQGRMLAITAALSLALCLSFLAWLYTYWRFPDIDTGGWAFYLFPTRAWELLAGSLCAWYMLKNPNTTIQPRLKRIFLVGLVLLLCFSIDDVHPRGNAIAAVLLTCGMVLGQDGWLRDRLLGQMIERVGDWSYSLYLVHWPLLAFAQVAYLGQVPAYIRVALAGISFILAYFQYRFVEQRFRYGFESSKKSAYRFIVSTTLLLFLLPFGFTALSHNRDIVEGEDFDQIRRVNYGLDRSCDRTYKSDWPSDCKTAEKPEFAIWGDSYAMHLVPGLLVNPALNSAIVQITKSACGPILGLALIDDKHSRGWAEDCNLHNKNALNYILATDSISHVVISSPFSAYFKDSGQSLLFEQQVIDINPDLSISQMVKTIRRIQEAGKTPIIFSPPPVSGFNIGDCLERVADNAIVLGRSSCDIEVIEYSKYQESIITALAEVQAQTGAIYVSLASLTCNKSQCKTMLDDVYLYRDTGHLSHAGSKALLSGLAILE